MNNRSSLSTLSEQNITLKTTIASTLNEIKSYRLSNAKFISQNLEKHRRYESLIELLSKENEKSSNLNHFHATKIMSVTESSKQNNPKQFKEISQNLKEWYKLQNSQKEKKDNLESEMEQLRKLFQPVIESEEKIEKLKREVEDTQLKLNNNSIKLCFYTWLDQCNQKKKKIEEKIEPEGKAKTAENSNESKANIDNTNFKDQKKRISSILFEESPLRYAVQFTPKLIPKLIFKKRVDDYPLHLATQICSKEAVQILLDHGFDPAEFDQNKKTTIFYLDQNRNHPDYAEIKKMLAFQVDKKMGRMVVV